MSRQQPGFYPSRALCLSCHVSWAPSKAESSLLLWNFLPPWMRISLEGLWQTAKSRISACPRLAVAPNIGPERGIAKKKIYWGGGYGHLECAGKFPGLKSWDSVTGTEGRMALQEKSRLLKLQLCGREAKVPLQPPIPPFFTPQIVCRSVIFFQYMSLLVNRGSWRARRFQKARLGGFVEI